MMANSAVVDSTSKLKKNLQLLIAVSTMIFKAVQGSKFQLQYLEIFRVSILENARLLKHCNSISIAETWMCQKLRLIIPHMGLR